ncbi:MAG: hypothetical protein COT71_02805 [Candidatus Andersenbacteria bacterium CG10_big_fil_rev_8_21_14_0_10_54_11]|uniref:Ribosomal RNA large subunit methyltransferase K/L-like methyltransferase domain-containing protein n=1 Tax=Candidatus Andersenbacteria bacterium CG10_big_fil_rev_8_21_14_0_10_54_11 TaxID=1974485 RepID=A0A2M6WZ56_9BACT|nr:MAG: hypothetical protein COT71_02805 [Candidatus Andersenbacteria bacterium CG10_big_fil_rev_8_21_14_0_10_54_11]
MQYVFFLGSHPALSVAEVLNVLRRDGISYRIFFAHERYMVIDVAGVLPIDFLRRLGGSERIARVVAAQPQAWLAAEIAAAFIPEGIKFIFGLNVWPAYVKALGSKPNAEHKPVESLARKLKAAWREQGYSARYTLPKRANSTLNAAQVIFNRLHEPPNLDLHLLLAGDAYVLAQTLSVQDIQAYEQRDTARPARDARVGMLPPKLAQIMLNLVPTFHHWPPTVYDPFCGTGTVLQEGLLFGWQMIGSDASPKMVRATKHNLAWLARHPLFAERLHAAGADVFQHDARLPLFAAIGAVGDGEAPLHDNVDAIVTEPYLGTPLTRSLSAAKATSAFAGIQQIYLSFFTQARKFLAPGGWVVFLLPAIKVSGQSGYTLFPASFLDRVVSLGYSQKQPAPQGFEDNIYPSTERGTLLYSRPKALVAREITLWEKR